MTDEQQVTLRHPSGATVTAPASKAAILRGAGFVTDEPPKRTNRTAKKTDD